jgi:hypothetical protein
MVHGLRWLNQKTVRGVLALGRSTYVVVPVVSYGYSKYRASTELSAMRVSAFMKVRARPKERLRHGLTPPC